MPAPPLLRLDSEEDYRQRFHSFYCSGPLTTFDGISVRFRKSDFDHAFFESSKRDGIKDRFSRQRAERMAWIQYALAWSGVELHFGWNKSTNRIDRTRRVAIVEDHVTIIRVYKPNRADFVTAYVADVPSTMALIRQKPVWGQ